MRILGLCGSLRAKSSNKTALEVIRYLMPSDNELIRYDRLAMLPHFNPDLDGDTPPEEVRAWRHLVGHCQAMIISCPEYAHGVPGSLKNALDWLVGSIEFPGKPVMLVDTSARATHALASLQEILTTMSARLIPAMPVILPLQGKNLDAPHIASDPALASLLKNAVTELTIAARKIGADA